MNELPLLSTTLVEDSEIDSLGHMNVRYYLQRAARANRQALENAGYHNNLPATQIFRQVDTYTQFRKEQFAGATLKTYGGLVQDEGGLGLDGVHGYFEIRNAETDEIAATLIITTQAIDSVTQLQCPTPSPTNSNLQALAIPKHGLPRSLSLQPPSAVTLERLESVASDDPIPGMGSGKRYSTVLAEDCDESGRLQENLDLMYVVHRPQPGDDLQSFGPPLLRDPQGRRYSWAMLETRSIVVSRPMAGDKIVSIGADVAQGEKWRQSRRWIFTQDTGVLLGISDTLGICIDLDARRSIPMPDDVRAAIAQNSLPELI